MTTRTKSTVHMLCVRSGLARQELSEEAQRLLAVYNDPKVPLEQKAIVRMELDAVIRRIEERVTTRRLNEAREKGFREGA